MSKDILRIEGLSLNIKGEFLIRDLSLAVQGGDILTLMGPSGIGKSSILDFICGNLSKDFHIQGEVWLNEHSLTHLPAEKRKIGILFQDDLLFPHLSVAANLAFGLMQEIKGPRRRELVDEALVTAGLTGYGDRDPATLSGGQRARISVMRTLLAQPKAILLDEPFNKLDSSLRQKFRDFVFAHIRKARLPCILVTHDKEDAVSTGGKIVLLKDAGFS